MALIPWYRWFILEFFSEGETFIPNELATPDPPSTGTSIMNVDYADSLETTTLAMGGGDVAIMDDVDDMEECKSPQVIFCLLLLLAELRRTEYTAVAFSSSGLNS